MILAYDKGGGAENYSGYFYRVKRKCKMCLAKVHLNDWGNETAVQDVAHMRLYDRRVELKTLLGEAKIVPGKVVEVDLPTSRILIDNHSDAD